MNEIRTIKPEVPALLLVVSCQHTAIPLLANKASQYLSFMLKNSSCSTTWEQHRFGIESPVLRSSNHFKDSISSKLRISLRGKEEASIVKGSILHTVKTRQAEVNDLSLVRCESETEPPGKVSSFLGHCSILLTVFGVSEGYRSCLIRKCLQWGEYRVGQKVRSGLLERPERTFWPTRYTVFWVRCHITDVETEIWIQNSTCHSCNWWGKTTGAGGGGNARWAIFTSQNINVGQWPREFTCDKCNGSCTSVVVFASLSNWYLCRTCVS